ncbi:MAG: hypothetical protein GX964_08860 [Syntrophomonadaceae bacterium]|nr:hypothetical protein [Syntrophomonadaceae bacterium]
MVKVKVGDDIVLHNLKVRVRFDYKGTRMGRLFGGKSVEQVAEEVREEKVALLRNVPVQGVTIEDIEMSNDVYTVTDEFTGQPVAFAPVTITFSADSLDDAIRFAMKEEFRKVEVLEPEQAFLNRFDIERLLFAINEQLKEFKVYLERKFEKG